jgi:hypothetical protein
LSLDVQDVPGGGRGHVTLLDLLRRQQLPLDQLFVKLSQLLLLMLLLLLPLVLAEVLWLCRSVLLLITLLSGKLIGAEGESDLLAGVQLFS